ncbi:hypothetical protein BGZ65_010087, partial [Modicella reniformis]
MNSSNVFDIPEILNVIANNLDRSSQFKCLHVCKVFHTAIVPKLWKLIELHPRPGIKRSIPSVAELERHKHYIQDLFFKLSSPEYLQLRGLSQLSLLAISDDMDTLDEVFDKTLVDLAGFIIAHSPTIQSVEIGISSYDSPSTPRILWSALGQCSLLRKIYLVGMTIPAESFTLFLQVCAKTRHLEFQDLHLPSWPVYPQHNEDHVSNGSSDDFVFTGPERLILSGVYSDPNPTLTGHNWGMMVRHFCNLKYLSLRERDVDRYNALFQTLSKEPWTLPSLQYLDMSLTLADDASLAGLIKQIHQLR